MSDPTREEMLQELLDMDEEDVAGLRVCVSDEIEWRAAVLDNLRRMNETLGQLAYPYSLSNANGEDMGDYVCLEDEPPRPSRWRRMVERVKTRIIEWWRPSVAFGPAGSRLRPVEEDVGASRRFFGAGGSGAGIAHEETEE